MVLATMMNTTFNNSFKQRPQSLTERYTKIKCGDTFTFTPGVRRSTVTFVLARRQHLTLPSVVTLSRWT